MASGDIRYRGTLIRAESWSARILCTSFDIYFGKAHPRLQLNRREFSAKGRKAVQEVFRRAVANVFPRYLRWLQREGLDELLSWAALYAYLDIEESAKTPSEWKNLDSDTLTAWCGLACQIETGEGFEADATLEHIAAMPHVHLIVKDRSHARLRPTTTEEESSQPKRTAPPWVTMSLRNDPILQEQSEMTRDYDLDQARSLLNRLRGSDA